MPYTEQHDAAALDRIACDLDKLARLTPQEQARLARLLAQVGGRPSSLIGPRWAGTRRDIAQLFATPGHTVKACGVTAVGQLVRDYLGLSHSELCMAAKEQRVVDWTRDNCPYTCDNCDQKHASEFSLTCPACDAERESGDLNDYD